VCMTRCVPISLKSFGKPDYKRHGLATAMLVLDNPQEETPYRDRVYPLDERDDPERRQHASSH
jgi:hypothetical protein